jgi:murein L,D-transpeptidase YcbB/YkuD
MFRLCGMTLCAGLAIGPALAYAQAAPPPDAAATGAVAVPEPQAAAVPAAPVAETPFQTALREEIAALPAEGTDEEKNERAAIAAFYEASGYAPLWQRDDLPGTRAAAAMDELAHAADWGLDGAEFTIPADWAAALMPAAPPQMRAEAELGMTVLVLKYARYARGGRIVYPGGQLNTNLDRRPQFIDPKTALDEIAAAQDIQAYLRGLHPQHPQFERLRQKYLEALGRKDAATAKRLLANMEEWRWMWRDMGSLHVLANVPEFMLHVVKNGETIHSERIVAGEIGKQTTIFSRRLKHIVLRPKWRVPESIKVHELWPSLKRGGAMMRKYDLQLETKDGQPLDYRTIDWSKDDIRNYEVTQPPGRKSVLGNVKFSFPSQHTIYMHDTPDKYMFNARQRTLTHGCLRVRDPMTLTAILLGEDKGWTRAQIDELSKSGPLNNEIAIEGKIPIHITYFTAWVDDGGTVKFYKDVYGHERRISLALDKKWAEIDKGRDHLAPVEPGAAPEPARIAKRKPKDYDTVGDLLGAMFGQSLP